MAYTQTIATADLGANQVTLKLTSATTGTGYFTLLAGTGTACGTAAQTKSGLGSTGAAAYRIGSLPLSSGVQGSYTVRNLIGSTAYTVCFTPDGTTAPATSNVTTNAGVPLGVSAWTRLGTTGYSPNPVNQSSLAFAPDGTPYVAYQDYSTGKAAVARYDGTAWTVVGTAGFSAGNVYYLSLAISPDGTPYLAYEDSASNSRATVMKYTGTAWVLVGAAGFTSAESTYESLAFAPDGTPYLAYASAVGYVTLYYSYYTTYSASVMKFNGTAWVLVGPGNFSPYVYQTVLTFTPDGTPYVSTEDVTYTYYDNGCHPSCSGFIAVSGTATMRRYNGSYWPTVGNPGISPSGTSYVTSAVAPDGTPYVAYSDNSQNGRATVMKYNGTAWAGVGQAGFSAGNTGYDALAFAPDGLPYLAYTDYGATGSNQQETAMRYNGTNWVLAGTALFSAPVYQGGSLAFSPNGTPHVSLSDGTVMKLVAVPTATTGAATSVTGTTATLNGTVNDDGAATSVSFQYGTTTSYGSTLTATNPAGGNLPSGSGSTAASVSLTGLTPSTPYHFRVVATANGVPVNGSDATFTTLALPAVTGINPTTGTTLGGTSVVITGSNFTGVTAVSFGATPATYTVNSATQITATSPAGTGTADVQVLTNAGSSPIVAADQFVYTKAAQTITFPQPTTPAQATTTANLAATASSSLPITYTITSGPASLSGSTVTYTGAGTVVIAAQQAGNASYNAATTVSRSVTVNAATTVTNFTAGANSSTTVGGNVTLAVQVSANGSPITAGTVAFTTTVGGSIYPVGTATLIGSTYTYTYNAAYAGANTLNVAFTPTNPAVYAANSTTTPLTVSKAAPVQYSNVNDQAVQNSVASTLTIIIGYPGTVAPTGAVTVTINGVSGPPGLGTPTCKAKALHTNCSFPYTSALPAGQYPLTFTQAADANYSATTGSSTLTVTAPKGAPTLRPRPVTTSTVMQPLSD